MARKQARMKTFVTGIILLLVTLLPTACAAPIYYKYHEEPSLPDSELVLIKKKRWIYSIDKKRCTEVMNETLFKEPHRFFTSMFAKETGKEYYQTMPGKHEFLLIGGYAGPDWPTEKTVCPYGSTCWKAFEYLIEFEKGHTYQITKVKTSTGEADYFLEDACHPLREMVKLAEGGVNRIE